MIDLRRTTHLLQNPVVHDGDVVGHRHRFDLIMSDIDGRRIVLDMQAPNSVRISSRSFASRAPIGSSINMALGRRTSARPMVTRCISPPASAEGRLPAGARSAAPWPRARADPRTSFVGGAQRESDILEGSQVRIERIELKNEGDVAIGWPAVRRVRRRCGSRRYRSLPARQSRAAWWSCRNQTARGAPRTLHVGFAAGACGSPSWRRNACRRR